VQQCRFEISQCPPAEVAALRRELGVSDPLAQVLVRRGMGDPSAARAFLEADETHSPLAFNGIEQALETIIRHVRNGSRITIHGDYDVDGICSTAILLRALRGLGADVDHYLPDRAADGYGLNEHTVRSLAERGTRLLVTADCAITAVEEVRLALELGLEVVVSDHHSPRADGSLPAAAIMHPALCGYPCPELCATAVAHKLAEALIDAFAERAPEGQGVVAAARTRLREDLDLVALATVADVVPLLGENRTLLQRGLRALASTTKPGLRALMKVARVDPARVDERSIGFGLAPRLNAAGRLYRADAGLELVLTEDPVRAAQIAQELDEANRERRQVELGIRYEAEAQMAALGERGAYVLAGEGWHPGVIGIVASRLVESSGRPVVLVAMQGERGRGSGRSIDGFDLLGGLSACSEHLLRFGGHSAAAGLEIERSSIEAFAAALGDRATLELGSERPAPLERVDAVVAGAELGMGLAEELARLAPHGRGNPTVSLMVADARFSDPRGMGEGKHVRFTVESGGARARAVAFGGGARLPVAEGEPAQATFTLEVNEWNGVSEPRLVLRRAAPLPLPVPQEAPPALAAPESEGELVLFALP
jgi:single-stranded-DNA-specific exonuclease